MRSFHVLISLLLLFFSTSCEKKKVEKTGLPVTSVTVFKVTPQNIPVTSEFLGVAASSHPVEIRARVEGYLTEIAFREGQPVKAGDVLFRLDPAQFEAVLHQAQGELAKQEALLVNAKQNLERLKPLYEKTAVSKRDLDLGVSQELSAQASVDSAKAQVEVAELNLSYTTIKSPISGLTGNAQSREGTFISPTINGLLTTVSVIDPIWVNFTISENEILKEMNEVKAGRIILPKDSNFDVILLLAAGYYYPEKGKVNFSSPTLDPMTGTMMVRSVFPNKEGIIRPGQFVRAEVIGSIRPNALFVPQTAVQQGPNGMFVYVVNQDKVESRPVIMGDWHLNYWIVNKGLEKDELVVVEGVNKIGPGYPVKITNVEEPKEPEQEKLCLSSL